MSNEAKSDKAVVLVIAEQSQAALAGGTLIPLARREWELLAALVEIPGRAKSSKELAWGTPSAVKYACRRLRRKLALCGLEGVVTYHRWWGYRYVGPVRKVGTIQEALGVEQSAVKIRVPLGLQWVWPRSIGGITRL